MRESGLILTKAGKDMVSGVCRSTVAAIERRKHILEKEEMMKLEEERRKKEDKPALSPSKWVENSYFVGASDSIYPKLRDVFCKIFEYQYHEIILGGATRYGKTTLAQLINGYVIYLLSCMGSPQRNFRLMEPSNILLLNMNVTEKKARAAYFSKFSAWIRSTSFFINEFPPKSTVITQLQFPKNIFERYAGASVTAPESEDLLFFCGDEVNLYDVIEGSKRAKVGTRFDAASEIESAVNRRMNGTFMLRDGLFPNECKIVWLCKETYPNSFIRNRIKEIRRNGLEKPGKAFILESTEWGMKPEGTYEQKYFHIRTASRMKSATILKAQEDVDSEIAEWNRVESSAANDDEKYKIFEVPLVHLSSAEDNLEKFIRDMCGWPTESISLFLRDRKWIRQAIRYSENGDYPLAACTHPFRAQEITLTEDEFIPLLCEQIDIDDETVWRPIVNPHVPRFAHFDAGLTTDPMGFAMGHQAGWAKVKRYDEKSESIAEELAPLVFIDLMIRILAEPGGQVSFGAARALVRKLSRYGFIFSHITMDSFQHVALSQPLADDGYNVSIVSVDTSMDAYDFLEGSLRENRLSVYDYPVFVSELVQLERVVTGRIKNGRPVVKVDHRPGERKDVCDAVAGVAWQVELAAKRNMPLNISKVEKIKTAKVVEIATKESSIRSAFENGDFEQIMEFDKTGERW